MNEKEYKEKYINIQKEYIIQRKACKIDLTFSLKAIHEIGIRDKWNRLEHKLARMSAIRKHEIELVNINLDYLHKLEYIDRDFKMQEIERIRRQKLEL